MTSPDATEVIELWVFDHHPNPKAVLDTQRDWDVCEGDWHAHIYQMLSEQWQEDLGIIVPPKHMRFSGFSYQGDGASFTRAEIDWATLLDKKDAEWDIKRRFPLLSKFYNHLPQPCFTVINHHYVHARTVSIEIEWNYHDLDELGVECLHLQYPNLPAWWEIQRMGDDAKQWYQDASERFTNRAQHELNGLGELVIDLLHELMDELYSTLGDEFEYLTGDTNLEEAFSNSDYLFDIDGMLH